MESKNIVNFISGHIDLTQTEFNIHYRHLLEHAIAHNESFVVGDAPGADTLAIQFLWGKTEAVIVYHMFTNPRNNRGFPTRGGFQNDLERDTQMTLDSDRDIAWVRTGREHSGTQANLERRTKM